MARLFKICDSEDYKCPYGFKERFANYSIEELIETFNQDHWKQAYVTARAYFYLALEHAFRKSGYDCSSFISEDGHIDLNYPLKLEGNRVVQIRQAGSAAQKDVDMPRFSGNSNLDSDRDSNNHDSNKQ